MCGLVGIMSSDMKIKHKDVLSCLLYLDTFRGRDSTGVAAIRHNGDTSVLKSTVPGYEFTEGKQLEEHLRVNDSVWIGHNRYGTVGRNIRSNAHPFMVLDAQGTCELVGAHNGTLKNKWVLTDHTKYGTDSEALLHEIAGITLEKTIEKVEGAWALTYYDHRAEEMRFLRNEERPLFYAFEADEKTIIWASEIWMIRVACSRSDIKLHEDRIHMTLPDTLYRIPATEKVGEKLIIEKTGGLVGKTPDFFQGRNTAAVGGTNAANQTPQQKATEAAQAARQGLTQTHSSGTKTPNDGQNLQRPKLSSSTALSSNKVVPIFAAKFYKGFNGTKLTKKELDDQLANGCSWCEKEFISSEDKYAWVAPSNPVCHKCLVGDHEDKEMIEAIFGQIPKKASIH